MVWVILVAAAIITYCAVKLAWEWGYQQGYLDGEGDAQYTQKLRDEGVI